MCKLALVGRRPRGQPSLRHRDSCSLLLRFAGEGEDLLENHFGYLGLLTLPNTPLETLRAENGHLILLAVETDVPSRHVVCDKEVALPSDAKSVKSVGANILKTEKSLQGALLSHIDTGIFVVLVALLCWV